MTKNKKHHQSSGAHSTPQDAKRGMEGQGEKQRQSAMPDPSLAAEAGRKGGQMSGAQHGGKADQGGGKHAEERQHTPGAGPKGGHGGRG